MNIGDMLIFQPIIVTIDKFIDSSYSSFDVNKDTVMSTFMSSLRKHTDHDMIQFMFC